MLQKLAFAISLQLIAATSVGASPKENPDSLAEAPVGLRAAIDRTLYAIERVDREDGTSDYRATHRAQSLTSTFGADGFRVQGTKNGTPFVWGLQLHGVGRGQDLDSVADAEIVHDGNRLELLRGNVTEWYVSDRRGVEQGFTLAERPAGDSQEPLRLEMHLLGDLVPVASGAVETHALGFGHSEDGPAVLRYEKLVAFDANGIGLPAEMVRRPARNGAPASLQLVVADAGAAYPVTIDPLVVLAETNISAATGFASDWFGYSVAIDGDVAVVGAPRDDDRGSDAGNAFVFQRDEGGTDSWGEAHKLFANDGADHDFFGIDVGVSGDTIVIGAYQDDDKGTDSGSAYVFERNGPSSWAESAKLTAASGFDEDAFGFAVAISGDTILVGAPYDDDDGADSGTAWVFSRVGGAWTSGQKLTASSATNNGHFGKAVSVSGDLAVIGAPLHGRAYAFVGPGWSEVFEFFPTFPPNSFGEAVAVSGERIAIGEPSLGRVLLWERSQPGSGPWTVAATLTGTTTTSADEFGFSVDISDDSVIVGSRLDDDDGADSGTAWLFHRDGGAAGNWGLVRKIVSATAFTEDEFGRAVAISGTTVIAGAPFDDDVNSDAGNAFVFDLVDETKVTAGDATAGDHFFSAGVSGDSAIIGAWGDDEFGSLSGAAYAFDRDEGGPGLWGQVEKHLADDGAADDRFGIAVAMSGNYAIVGARFDDDGGADSGSAYVYERDPGDPDLWHEKKLTASDAAAGDLFGVSVAISGETAVVGASEDADAGASSGSVYVFDRDGSGNWIEVAKLGAGDDASTGDIFGVSVGVSGNTAIVGASGDLGAAAGAGAAYVFDRDKGGAGSWGEIARLTASDGDAGDAFGVSVAISGDEAIVGANFDTAPSVESGSAYIFSRNHSTPDAWGQRQKLTAYDAGAGDRFGGQVSIAGHLAIVGSHLNDDAGGDSGSAYVYARDDGGANAWRHIKKLTASDEAAGDLFGLSVAISGATAVVGARDDDDGGADSGSAYFFELDEVLPACSDGLDDDGDGLADYPLDPGCADSDDLSELDPLVACDDGVDNDGDGITDFAGGDPGCRDPADTTETDPALPCDDGIDNDGDGRTDHDPATAASPGDALNDPAGTGDPVCRDPWFSREDAICQDGIDNDSKFGTDYDGGRSILGGGATDPDGPDPTCGQPWFNREEPKGCGLGFELAFLLPLLMRARGRWKGARTAA